MQEHAPDILALALWSLVAVGSALLATLGYIWSKLDKRLDAQDGQMSEIRGLITSEVYELREMAHDHDKRITILERHMQ